MPAMAFFILIAAPVAKSEGSECVSYNQEIIYVGVFDGFLLTLLVFVFCCVTLKKEMKNKHCLLTVLFLTTGELANIPFYLFRWGS